MSFLNTTNQTLRVTHVKISTISEFEVYRCLSFTKTTVDLKSLWDHDKMGDFRYSCQCNVDKIGSKKSPGEFKRLIREDSKVSWKWTIGLSDSVSRINLEAQRSSYPYAGKSLLLQKGQSWQGSFYSSYSTVNKSPPSFTSTKVAYPAFSFVYKCRKSQCALVSVYVTSRQPGSQPQQFSIP